jgi:hypothetical protein
LPYRISASGDYVLASDLTYPNETLGLPATITVSGSVNGAVVLDLKGFNLIGPGSFAYDVTAVLAGYA